MKPLIETNPYLKNKDYREASNKRSVHSSYGVEGIVVTSEPDNILVDHSRSKKALEKIKARVKR